MPKNSAEYQRAYRERTRLSAPDLVFDEAGSTTLAELKAAFAPERQYVNPPGQHSRYQYLPGDHAVGDMSQQARDHVLARMPVLTRIAR